MCSFQEVPLKKGSMLLSFHPPGRNLGLVAGAGIVILEHKATLEVEAAQVEHQ